VSVVCPGRVNTPIYDTSKLVGFDKEKVMALWPRGITAKRAASIILRGVARNRATIVVTQHARVFAWMYRASPSLSLRIARLYMRRVREAKVPGARVG
jgi:short-subunit dehydrogenase